MAIGTQKTGLTNGQNVKRPHITDGFADVSTAKQVLRQAAESAAGRARFATTSTQADEVRALAVLSGSSDVLDSRDVTLFTGLSGFASDGTPTWGELVTALSS